MYETASKRIYKSKRCVLFMTFRPSQRTLFMARRIWVLLALKKMIGITRRAMNLAHGGRVVERVEVKRESPSSTPTEDWDDRPANNYLPEAENWDKEANESSYTIEGRNLAIPAYRTVRRVAWGERCAACGGCPLRCACST